MENEKKIIELTSNGNIIKSELFLYDEFLEDAEKVCIEILLNGKIMKSIDDNYFDALLNMRKKLEQKGIQIMCNGAVRNVFPSRMQLSMGTGRLAYKLTIGQPAKVVDVVDIFEYEISLIHILSSYLFQHKESNYYNRLCFR